MHSHPQTSSLAVSLVLILILAQTLPKALGVRAGGVLAGAFAGPLTVLMRFLGPVRLVVSGAAAGLLRAFGSRADDDAGEALAEDDIREMVEAGSRQGLLDVTERELLVNLLRSGDIKASDIMTPRHEIEAVPAGASESEVRALLKKSDFSRLPVYEGSRDHYVGVITAKDLLKLRKIGDQGGGLRDVMRPVAMVPESRRITDLLLDFKRGRLHLALVADEFGSVSGLVTMEDVLEEIFGEVNEADDEPELVELGDNHWKVLGSMEAADFNAVTGARLRSSGSGSIAGLVLARIGRRPRPGDQVRVGNFTFEVMEVKGIIIHRLEVRREAEK
jgi:CBS domain containing-hemolysin-like protein